MLSVLPRCESTDFFFDCFRRSDELYKYNENTSKHFWNLDSDFRAFLSLQENFQQNRMTWKCRTLCLTTVKHCHEMTSLYFDSEENSNASDNNIVFPFFFYCTTWPLTELKCLPIMMHEKSLLGPIFTLLSLLSLVSVSILCKRTLVLSNVQGNRPWSLSLLHLAVA